MVLFVILSLKRTFLPKEIIVIESKPDRLIWWLMITFMAIILAGGSAWATKVNSRIDEMADMKTTIAIMQHDVTEIKDIIKSYVIYQKRVNFTHEK